MKKQITIKEKTPSLSVQAENLIVMAVNGEIRLKHWIVYFHHAWNELPILREPFSGGFFKWIDHTTKSICLTRSDFDITCMFDQGLDLIEMYANETKDLFECFFKLFPQIDLVETSSISGLGFENPFKALLTNSITQEDFLKRALQCKRTDDFIFQWEQLQQKIKNRSEKISSLSGKNGCENQTENRQFETNYGKSIEREITIVQNNYFTTDHRNNIAASPQNAPIKHNKKESLSEKKPAKEDTQYCPEYCSLKVPDTEKIVEGSNLERLAQKIGISRKTLCNKAIIFSGKLYKNPENQHYWIYESEKGDFSKPANPGRPRNP